MKNTKQKWFFWIGMTIVVVTHVYILISGLPEAQIVPHAILNLFAAGSFGLARYS